MTSDAKENLEKDNSKKWIMNQSNYRKGKLKKGNSEKGTTWNNTNYKRKQLETDNSEK